MAQRAYTTFLNLPAGDRADLLIRGAPSDLSPTGQPGARFGPDAIRAASHGFFWEPQDHHGVMFTHAVAEGLIDPAATIQIGIRTWHDRASHPFAVLDADWVDAHGPEATGRAIRDRVGNRAVHVSFDVDALDTAFAPGTGTPVRRGLATITALAGAGIAPDLAHLMVQAMA